MTTLFVLSFIFVFLVHTCISQDFSSPESRHLFITSCESRISENGPLRFLNISSHALVQQGASFMNACNGPYSRHISKPKVYLAYITKTLSNYNTDMQSNIHFLLLDSDTILSVSELKTLWSIYDNIRGDKDIVVSSEQNCWVGGPCTPQDLLQYYNNTSQFSTISPFINSGAIMGSTQSLQTMLTYILDNEKRYWSNKTPGLPFFCDQHAVVDYTSLYSHLISVDYYQQLVGSFQVLSPPGVRVRGDRNKADTTTTIVHTKTCKGQNGTAIIGCRVLTNNF